MKTIWLAGILIWCGTMLVIAAIPSHSQNLANSGNNLLDSSSEKGEDGHGGGVF